MIWIIIIIVNVLQIFHQFTVHVIAEQKQDESLFYPLENAVAIVCKKYNRIVAVAGLAR